MPRQFFIAPLLCAVDPSGLTTCAPKVNPQQVNYVAACQESTAPTPQCLVLASGDTSAAEGDSALVSLVADNFDTTIASLSNNVKNRISNGLSSKGVVLTETVYNPPFEPTTRTLTLNDFVTVRDFLQKLGEFFDPNFVLESFWVSN
jgi:hypothetical protein